MEARLQYERDIRAYLESKVSGTVGGRSSSRMALQWKSYGEELEGMKDAGSGSSSKLKDKLNRLAESVATLERHMEQGNRKMDRVVAAEIQSRKLHEKGTHKVMEADGLEMESLRATIQAERHRRPLGRPPGQPQQGH